jgi:hypothetical protein
MGRRSVPATALATFLLALALAFALALAAGFAPRPADGAGEGPVTVEIPDRVFTFGASVSPKALSRTTPTPVPLFIEGRLQLYSEPTDLAAVGIRSLDLELDRHIDLDAAALPLGALLATGTAHLLVAGSGEPPAPVPIDGTLVVYNRGARPGGAVLRLVLTLPAPIEETVATRIVIRSVPRGTGGRFGSRATVAIPKFAGGSAVLVGFALRFARSVPAGTGAVPVFTATCSDGKIVVDGRAEFGDGSVSETETVRACTPRP